MTDARLVDTNVLIVASAADTASPFQPGNTPIQEKLHRDKVLGWLRDFEFDSTRHAILDWDWHICSEYCNKLNPEQDYGWLAMMAKRDHDQVVWVGLELDNDGHALLPPVLSSAVTDLADRKMIAAILAAQADQHACRLVNACDTDWLDCENVLIAEGVQAEHLLEFEWLRPKWQSMKCQK